MALTRVINYIAKFSGGLVIPTGASSSAIARSSSEGKLEWGKLITENVESEAISEPKIKNKACTTAKINTNSVTLEKLAEAVSKQIPAEHGRSAEMVAGKITISAPAVTAAGAIIISPEGTTMTVGIAVVERTPGTGFKVEGAATSTDRINWSVWKE